MSQSTTNGRQKPPVGDSGTPQRQQRWVDPDDVKKPADVTDPGSLSDEESGRDIRGWLKQNWPYVLIGVPVALAATVLFLGQIARFIPELVTSRRFQIIVGATILFVGTAWYTWKWTLEMIRGFEYLSLKKDDNDDEKYYGKFYERQKEVPPRFAPAKRVGLFGLTTEYLTVEELDPTLAQKWASKSPDNSEDDKALIWLSDQFLGKTETDFGTDYLMQTAGISVDTFGGSAMLYAEPPRTASPEQVDEYEEVLRAVEDEVAHQRSIAQRLLRQLRDHEELDDPVDDAIDDFLDRYERVEYAHRSPRGRRQRDADGDLGDPMQDEYDNYQLEKQ